MTQIFDPKEAMKQVLHDVRNEIQSLQYLEKGLLWYMEQARGAHASRVSGRASSRDRPADVPGATPATAGETPALPRKAKRTTRKAKVTRLAEPGQNRPKEWQVQARKIVGKLIEPFHVADVLTESMKVCPELASRFTGANVSYLLRKWLREGLLKNGALRGQYARTPSFASAAAAAATAQENYNRIRGEIKVPRDPDIDVDLS